MDKIEVCGVQNGYGKKIEINLNNSICLTTLISNLQGENFAEEEKLCEYLSLQKYFQIFNLMFH